MTNKKNPLSSNYENLESLEGQKDTNEMRQSIDMDTWNQKYGEIQKDKELLHHQQKSMATKLSINLKDETSEKIALSATLPATLKPYVTEIYYYQRFDDGFIDQLIMDDENIKMQRKYLFSHLKLWYITHIKHDFPQDREKRVQTTLQEFVDRKDNIKAIANYISQTMFATYVDRLESRGVHGNMVKNLRNQIEKEQMRFDQGKMPTSIGFASVGYLPKRYWLYKDRTSSAK